MILAYFSKYGPTKTYDKKEKPNNIGKSMIMNNPMTEKVLSMINMIQWTILKIRSAPSKLKMLKIMIKVYI